MLTSWVESVLHHLRAQPRGRQGLPEGTRSPLGLNSASASVTTADQVPTVAGTDSLGTRWPGNMAAAGLLSRGLGATNY